jgi:glycine betaine/proline transport system ATP-binding protein
MKVIEQVGLSGSETRVPEALSGGMRQRVGLARALCCETPIVLMDEPFAALDPVIRESLQNDLLELQRKFSKTFVFITHDVDEAIRLGTRIGILNQGRLLQVGTPLEILLAPASPTVEGFVRHVNLARAIPIFAALDAAAGNDLVPAADWRVDHLLDSRRPLEDALPYLLKSTDRVGVQRDGRFLGLISRPRVIDLLTRQGRVSSPSVNSLSDQ